MPDQIPELNRRFHIIGGPGSGKTTVARRLSARTGIPSYHLDDIAYVGPDFLDRPSEDKVNDVQRILRQPAWITEGIHIGWTEALLEAADLIVWLDDLPWYRAIIRILARFTRGAVREMKHQPGRRKFTRFPDYARHMSQLFHVFSSSNHYYKHKPDEPDTYPVQPALTDASTAQLLTQFGDKVIRCNATRSPETIVEDVLIESVARRQPEAMKRDPLVSVAINNYNYGRFLREAIDSALAQTYPKVEVVVVDDGSVDGSIEIIESYCDKIIPILQSNAGQAAAFNAAVAAAKGDIVIFLDADDVLLPGAVHRVVAAFQAWPNTAKVQYRMAIIDEDGHTTGMVKPPSHLSLKSGNMIRQVLSFPDDMTWMATSGNAFPAWVLKKIMPMPERDFRILADLYVSHLSVLHGRVTSIEEIGAYYRVHSSNNYDSPRLDLDKIRAGIAHMSLIHEYILDRSNVLGYSRVIKESASGSSISFIGHRMVSLRLDPARHPLQGDTATGLLLQGISASFSRFDVLLPMKALFICWFIAMAVAPRSLARWLAERFLYAETRGRINGVLALLHETDPQPLAGSWRSDGWVTE